MGRVNQRILVHKTRWYHSYVDLTYSGLRPFHSKVYFRKHNGYDEFSTHRLKLR